MNELNTTTSQIKETISEQDQLVNARREALKNTKNEPKGGFEWLTDHSLNFLNSGYLTKGVTAEQRIREIADRAEQLLDMPGFSDKFFGYMSEGFFSLASPVWSSSLAR